MTAIAAAARVTLLAAIAAGSGRGQTPPQETPQATPQATSSATPQATPSATIRSTSQEVLLDIVVRDKKSHIIKNLTAADFALADDGQPQRIRSFRVITAPAKASEAMPEEGADRVAGSGAGAGPVGGPVVGPVAGPVAIDPYRQFRVVTLVFDQLSQEARRNARAAVADLLTRERGPNLFLAVVSIEDGFRMVQQYTTDKNLIAQAVKDLTATPYLRYKSSDDLILRAAAENSVPGSRPADAGGVFGQMARDMAQFNAQGDGPMRTRGWLFGLETLIAPQVRLPGRKSLLLFCEGLSLQADYRDEFSALIGAANRANVSVYGIDVRGLTLTSQLAGPSAALSAAIAAGSDSGTAMENYEAAVLGAGQDSLEQLSKRTGGFMIANTNDFRPGIRRFSEDLDSHYEISYSPDIRSFDGRFRTVAVTVNRPGAKVQTRNGYFALPFLPGQPVLPYEMPLLGALAAGVQRNLPFRTAGFHFFSSAGGTVEDTSRDTFRNTMELVIDVPLESIQFNSDQERGVYIVHFSVLALLKDRQGAVLKKFSQDISRQGPLDRMPGFKAGHFIYTQSIPLPPGRFTLETAVIDRSTDKVGVKRTSILMPRAAEKLNISSVVRVRSIAPSSSIQLAVDFVGATNDDPLETPEGKVTPSLDDNAHALSGAVLRYFFTVYLPPGAEKSPALRVDFLQDGKVIYRGQPEMPAPDFRGYIPVVVTTPIDSLQPGVYEVRVMSMQAGKAVAERTTIVIE